jgi:hypothetical protein
MALAAHYGIPSYPNPAGGCLLTDVIFSRRLRDLFQHGDSVTPRDVELLKVGRHMRLDDRCKLVVGRNQEENQRLSDLRVPDDMILDVKGYPSPLALIPGGAPETLVPLAAAILLRYSDAPGDQTAVVIASDVRGGREIAERACIPEQTRRLQI